MSHLRGVSDTFGQAKISDFEVKLMVDHDIGRIEISMNDFFLIVHIPENRQETDEQFPYHRLLEKLAFLTLIPY